MPFQAPAEEQTEVVQIFPDGGSDVEALAQEVVEGVGSTLLGSDNDEIRQRICRLGSNRGVVAVHCQAQARCLMRFCLTVCSIPS